MSTWNTARRIEENIAVLVLHRDHAALTSFVTGVALQAGLALFVKSEVIITHHDQVGHIHTTRQLNPQWQHQRFNGRSRRRDSRATLQRSSSRLNQVLPELVSTRVNTADGTSARISNKGLEAVNLIGGSAVGVQVYGQAVSERVLSILNLGFNKVNNTVLAGVSTHFQSGYSQVNRDLTPWIFSSRQNVHSRDIQYVIARITLVRRICRVFQWLNNTQATIFEADFAALG